MIDIKSNIRKAIGDALTPLIYMGKKIPINQDFLTYPPAIINIGNSSKMEAYIIFQNQTVTNASTKHCFNEVSTFQLDVVTVFNANSGGSIHAENIATEILTILDPNNSPNMPLYPNSMHVWKMRLLESRGQVQETQSSRIFRNILTFTLSVNQYRSST